MEIKGVYDFTISGIDGNGFQYYTGMLEPERLDAHGLRCGRAFSVDLDHRKQASALYTFNWIGGAPHAWKLVTSFKGEIIAPEEVAGLLQKYGLLPGKEAAV